MLAREAELKMLRYQINPHFLFNTLNAVSALIVTGQTLAAEAMVGKLARFFRNALSRESTAKVTLEEELRVQLEYLNIELTRFPDRLSWSTDIEARPARRRSCRISSCNRCSRTRSSTASRAAGRRWIRLAAHVATGS